MLPSRTSRMNSASGCAFRMLTYHASPSGFLTRERLLVFLSAASFIRVLEHRPAFAEECAQFKAEVGRIRLRGFHVPQEVGRRVDFPVLVHVNAPLSRVNRRDAGVCLARSNVYR